MIQPDKRDYKGFDEMPSQSHLELFEPAWQAS